MFYYPTGVNSPSNKPYSFHVRIYCKSDITKNFLINIVLDVKQFARDTILED